ncbi:hypothetical protein EZV62_001856 [Acer yangbiense]|uniref:Uncharacterized protein n=1 Tax=Acer yangbiense TaxID=1000413 RepID=A0A5C7IVC8_9ROSI|nr:hypothetical protein EZV62_001856 [Acer yangbiense]
MVLAEAKRSLESLPMDLAAAIRDGKIPGAVITRFLELEKSGLMRWLMQFGGFKERLLADDLFLAKTAAEYDRRRENFFNELEIVFADVVMAIIADFMLVYLPAPTVALRSPLLVSAGPISKFFYNCPDNAFQVALPGSSYSLLHRIGAIVRNGTKLFAVGTTSSLVGTAVTNALINARKAVDKSAAGEVENVPILSTSAAYGVYMAISSNLRYQVLAGVVEQRILEPFLHRHKLILSALCFAVRTGNTYLGSLLIMESRVSAEPNSPNHNTKEISLQPVARGKAIANQIKEIVMLTSEGHTIAAPLITNAFELATIPESMQGVLS